MALDYLRYKFKASFRTSSHKDSSNKYILLYLDTCNVILKVKNRAEPQVALLNSLTLLLIDPLPPSRRLCPSSSPSPSTLLPGLARRRCVPSLRQPSFSSSSTLLALLCVISAFLVVDSLAWGDSARPGVSNPSIVVAGIPTQWRDWGIVVIVLAPPLPVRGCPLRLCLCLLIFLFLISLLLLIVLALVLIVFLILPLIHPVILGLSSPSSSSSLPHPPPPPPLFLILLLAWHSSSSCLSLSSSIPPPPPRPHQPLLLLHRHRRLPSSP